METTAPSNWRAVEGDFPLENDPFWSGEPLSIPTPNSQLRAASSIGDIGPWYAIGEAWAQIAVHFMPPDPTVLDIGCGCGKMARFFYLVPNPQYIGVDIFLPSILWCRKAFRNPAGDRFTFEHFDGTSEVYNPTGTLKPSDYRLPTDDASIDMTICASLFTHLLEEDCRHYLAEIRRVSKPRGLALISIHNEPPHGERFAGDESRIDIEEAYFVELAARSGFACRQVIGNIYGQQVILFEQSIDSQSRSRNRPRIPKRDSTESGDLVMKRAKPLDPRPLLSVPLLDLGAILGSEMAGILVPESEVGRDRVGVSDQFLADAATYHNRFAKDSSFRNVIADAFGRMGTPRGDALILDVGSGSGRSVLPCLDLLPESQVVAVDISPNLLNILKRTLESERRYSGRVALITMQVIQDFFEAGQFDLVVGAAILHHLIEPREALLAAGKALKPGGHAIFFEPFENGNAILRIAYGEILTEVERGRPLGAPVLALIKALVKDFEVRSQLSPTSPLLEVLDDKWMFTKSFFEESAELAGFRKVTIYPLHPVDKPFSRQTEITLKLGTGLEATALDEWAWKILSFYDDLFSQALKQDLLVEGTVILSK